MKEKNMKAYIIWESVEERPMILRENFGPAIFFLSKESAQAFLKDIRVFCKFNDVSLMIKEVDLKID